MATITGTSGNDVLDSNLLEDDTIQGQGGNDLFRYYLTAWDDVIVDTGGNDTIQFDSALDFKAFAMFRWGDDLYIDLQDSGTITVENHFLSTNNRIETLEFDGYTFDLTATNLIVAQEGGYTNFTLNNPNGTSGADLIFVGFGQDWNDYVISNSAGTPNSTSAGAGDDIIFANYANYVWGREGNDIVYGHARSIWLGQGDDVYYGSNKTDYPSHGTFVAGGDGNDTIHGTNQNDGLRGDYDNKGHPGGGYAGDLISPGDDIIYGYGGDDSIMGGAGNDELYGGDGNDTVVGEDGNDLIYGDDGDDQISAGNGIDVAYGGNGNDTMRAGATGGVVHTGQKTLHGGNGNDIIYGGGDNDFLYGDEGDDKIDTRDGSDQIYGGIGDDYFVIHTKENEIMEAYGGSGNDIFVNLSVNPNAYMTLGDINGDGNFQDGFGNETYVFYHSNGASAFYDMGDITITDNAGLDEILIQGGVLSDMNFTVLGDDLIIDFDQAIGSITIKDHFIYTNTIEDFNFGSFNVSTKSKTINTPYSFVERLTTGDDGPYYADSTTSFIGSDRNIVDGLAGNDEIHLGVGADIAYGREGNDEIYGGDGNDVILGGAQDDTLYGGNDDDTLIGGTGADNLYGNSGFDTVDYSSSYLAVNIDFLYGTASGGDATGDTFTGIEAVIGSNTAGEQDNIWGDANSNSLYGMGGDDTLQGGGGADYIDGGTGWDTASYDRSYSGVNINLETGVHTGGQAAGDTLVNIEAITGSDYDDTLYGDDTENYFYGGNGDDHMIGGKSEDQFWGQGGADTLAFLDTNDLDAADLFHDFDTTEGDALDISAILVGYDPLTDAIADFVSITDNGTDSFVAVDVDGGADNFITIAQLNGVTGLNAQDMETDGNLITTTI